MSSSCIQQSLTVSFDLSAPHTTKFSYFSPPKHGTDNSCANHLEAGFRLERLAVLLIGVILPVGENDEDVTMTFQSISTLLGIAIPFNVQECIDELNRRLRLQGRSEIPWSSMDILYSRGRQYWEDRLASESLVEHSVLNDENEEGRWSFSTDDTVHLIKVVKLLQNVEGIPNNLRDILVTMDLYPNLILNERMEASVVLDLKLGRPPKEIITNVLEFVFTEEYFTDEVNRRFENDEDDQDENEEEQEEEDQEEEGQEEEGQEATLDGELGDGEEFDPESAYNIGYAV